MTCFCTLTPVTDHIEMPTFSYKLMLFSLRYTIRDRASKSVARRWKLWWASSRTTCAAGKSFQTSCIGAPARTRLPRNNNKRMRPILTITPTGRRKRTSRTATRSGMEITRSLGIALCPVNLKKDMAMLLFLRESHSTYYRMLYF